MTTRHRKVLIAGLVGTLAAWSPGLAVAQQPGTPHPCTLLTAAQVGHAIGVAVGAGTPIGTMGCEWDAAAHSGSHARATLSLWGADAFSGMKAPLPNVTKTAARGIGEDAMYATIGSLTTLSVKKGSAAFVVRLYGIEGRDRQMALEKALALDVVSRL